MGIRTGKYLEDIAYGVQVYYSTKLKAADAYKLIEEHKEMLSDTIAKMSFQGSPVGRLKVTEGGGFEVSRCDIWYWESIAAFKKAGQVKLYGTEVEVFGESGLTADQTMVKVQRNIEALEEKAQHLLHNNNGAVCSMKVYEDGQIDVHTDWLGYWFTAVQG